VTFEGTSEANAVFPDLGAGGSGALADKVAFELEDESDHLATGMFQSKP